MQCEFESGFKAFCTGFRSGFKKKWLDLNTSKRVGFGFEMPGFEHDCYVV